MADLSSLILTVLGLSSKIATTLYNYVTSVREAQNDIQRLSNEIFGLMGVLEHLKLQQGYYAEVKVLDLEEMPNNLDQNTMTKVLHDHLALLQELYDHLTRHRSHLQAKIQRLVWPLKDKDTEKYLQRLERTKSYFILSLVTDQQCVRVKHSLRIWLILNSDLTRDITKQISNLEARMDEEAQIRRENESYAEYQELIKWLSPVNPRRFREDAARTRVSGSGQWFLKSKSFRAWLESSSNTLFWLNGISMWLLCPMLNGTSVLIAPFSGCWEVNTDGTPLDAKNLRTTALDYCTSMQKNGERTGYFYCSFSENESLDTRNILGSILVQLSTPDDKTFEQMSMLYEKKNSEPGRARLFKPQKKDILDLIFQLAQKQSGTQIFIDAVNECEDPLDIIESLKILMSENSKAPIRVFLTSINEREIEMSLESVPSLHTETLRHRHIEGDMGLLIDAKLHSHPRLKRQSKELQHEIAWTLIHRAQGILFLLCPLISAYNVKRFRWVTCQLDFLCKLRTAGAIKEALSSLPPTLDETYRRLLLRIETKEDRHLSREIMEILAFAMYPITLTALCEVLMIELGSKSLNADRQLLNPKDILNICGSFLNYEPTTDTVSLAHQSVRTFLTSSLQGEATFFQLSHDDSHRSIALKCLTYLSLDEFESERMYGSVDDRLDDFPFLHYAAHFWPLHVLRLNRVEQDQELWETMKSFLLSTEAGRNNFRAWVQVLAPGSNFIQDTPPLYYAASFGLTDIVRYLLDMGSDTEARGGHGGATPINIASLRGNAEVVQLLLDHGADPYAVDIGM
ncbi:MAG: hypothetical protein Q9214_005666, partial [Letrouitia sp. 1 TL-2023]